MTQFFHRIGLLVSFVLATQIFNTSAFAQSGNVELSTLSASSITATTALLSVKVRPGATAASVDFYVDDQLAGTAPVMHAEAPGISSASFGARYLAPHAAHSAYVVARNAGGFVTDQTTSVYFETLNRKPVLTSARYVLDASGVVRIPEADLLKLATDPDGDALSIYYPPRYSPFSREVTAEGAFLVYRATSPAPPDYGPRTFPLTVVDFAGGYSNAVEMQVVDLTPPTISIDVSSLGTFKAGDSVPDLRPLAVTHDNAPGVTVDQSPAPGVSLPPGLLEVTLVVVDGGGNSARTTAFLLALTDEPTVLSTISTAPTGSNWAYLHVGIPSIGPRGELLFRATERQPGFLGDRIVLMGGPQAGQPNAGGVYTATATPSLSQPVMSATGQVAFTGRLAKPNGQPGELAVFSTLRSSNSGYREAPIVVQTGEVVPGLGDGKVVGIEQIVLENDELLLLLRVTGRGPGHGQVLARCTKTGALQLMARTGTKSVVEGVERELVAIRGFEPVNGSPGQGRAFVGGGDGAVVARLEFHPKTEVIATLYPGGQIFPEVATGQPFTAAVAAGQALAGTLIDVGTASHGFAPGTNRPTLAYGGSVYLDGGARQSGVFVQNTAAAGGPITAVARVGDPAPGLEPRTFQSFSDPVLTMQPASGARIAFTAKLTGPRLNASNNEALFFGEAKAGGAHAVARLSDLAPGTEGAQLAEFVSFCLPGWEGAGPLFTARMTGGDSKPGHLGLWSADVTGNVRLVLRTGDQMEIAGEQRTVRTIAVLQAMPGSSAQHRATNLLHQVALKVVFFDFTEAVVTIQLP